MNLKEAIKAIGALVWSQKEIMETPATPHWMELLHPRFACIATKYHCGVEIRDGVFYVQYYPLRTVAHVTRLQFEQDLYATMDNALIEACKRAREKATENPA